MIASWATFLIDPSCGWPYVLPLLTAHLLADFPLQPKSWVDHRRKHGWASGYLYLHAGICGVMAYVAASAAFTTLRIWWLLPLISVTHVLFDGFKARTDDRCWHFVLDQIAHLAIVLLAAFLLMQELPRATPLGYSLWLCATAFLLTWWGEGNLIEKATARWRDQFEDAGPRGLAQGGLWIGRLERSLIVLFVLTEHYEATGFLIAAKSVLRFGEVSRPGHRGEAEYVLVGTLASFLLAILTGLGARYLLGW